MNENGSWGNARSSSIKVGMIVRLILALLTTCGSIALAWTLLNPHENAQASGIVEVGTATYPWGLAQDGKHIWVAQPGCKLTPTCSIPVTGTIGEYSLAHPIYGRLDFTEPSGYSSPAFVALDGQGNIWFTEPTTDAIGELTPTGTGLWQQWTTGISAGSAPFDLTFDNNGNIWFTEVNGNNIGFFDTTNHTAVENAVPSSGSQPYGIGKAPDGTIWFTESNARKLGTFTPTTNGTITISEHSIGLLRAHLLSFDSSGNVWYSEGHADAVGEYTPSTKTAQNFSILSALCPTPVSTATPTTCGTNTFVAGIGIDGNGMVWFDESNTGSVGFVNPASGVVTVITTVSGAFDGLIVDGSNNIWVSKLPHRLVEIPAGTPPTTPTPSPSVTNTATATPTQSPTVCPSPSPIVTPSTTPTVSPTASATASPSTTPSPTVSPSPCPSPGPSPSPSPTGTPSTTTTGPVSKTWYFAEGKVGAGFTEFLTLENPDTVNSCAVNIEYLLGTGSPVNVSVAVAAATRFTESVNADLKTPASDGNYQTDSAVVTVNSSLSPNCTGIVAERPMYFTNFVGVSSGSDVLGATKTGITFYFADVPTGGGYASFLTILNPGTITANITATFVVHGATVNTQTLAVAGGTRGTIIPNNSGTLLHAAVTVTSNQPVVVERPTYFSNVNGGNAQTVSGASSVVGVSTLKNNWLFAEGYTGGKFQEYFVLANFGTTAVSANVMLEFSNGHTETVSEVIAPFDQTFVDVNSIVANHPGTCDTTPCQTTQDVSAQISSTSNFIAEREMFFHYDHVGNGRTLLATGGTDVIGQGTAVSSYSFAEGYTNLGYDEWLTLQNPSGAIETVTLKMVNEDGRSFSQSYSLLPHSRFTIDITALVLQNLIVPNDTFKGYEVSLTTKAGSGAVFMAERPMYWNTGSGGTQGGSDVIGYDGG